MQDGRVDDEDHDVHLVVRKFAICKPKASRKCMEILGVVRLKRVNKS